jgi:hypothetical protein
MAMKEPVMTLLSRLVAKHKRTHRASRVSARQPALEILEDRCTPSTTSSIVGSFNGTAIPAGDTIWFNSAFTAANLPKGTTVTVHVENAAVDFTSGGVAYHVAIPNTIAVLTPNATSASVSFDPSDNDWDVSAPTGGAGNTFMAGAALPVTSNLPGGIKNVTWSAAFWSDTSGVTINWRWGAAIYPSFGTDNNALNVKPVDNNNLSVYANGDHAGTPEAYKTLVIAGGTGGGGNNYTGNLTPAKAVNPTLGDGLQDYPFPSSNPLTSVAFNESSVVKAAKLDLVNGTFEVWYSDEHALALGVRQVNVKTATGTATTNYTVTPLTTDPGSALNASVGSTITTGDQAGTDTSGRPMFPSLFISDTTNDPNNRSGDWQYGGTALPPGAVFGAWKGVVRTVDYTTATPTTTVACDIDPVKNSWNLGAGSDAPPAGTGNEGYGAEVRWSLSDLQNQGLLIPGHTYRFYVIVHDGDQNKVGGDCGQASFNYSFPGVANQTASISGLAFDYGLGQPIVGEVITLTGTDVFNNPVTMTAVTDANGNYSFTGLKAGTYTLTGDSSSTVSQAGTDNGSTDGTASGNQITGIVLGPSDNGLNYDFFKLAL